MGEFYFGDLSDKVSQHSIGADTDSRSHQMYARRGPKTVRAASKVETA